MNEQTQRGINALKAGDRASARRYLSEAITQDPTDIQAWIWLSGTVEQDAQRLDCLLHAQRLDPANPVVQRGIQQILARNPSLQSKLVHAESHSTPARKVIPAPPMAVEPDQPAEKNLEPEEAANLLDRAVQLPPAPSPQTNLPPSTTAPQPVEDEPDGVRIISPIYPRTPRANYSTNRSVFKTRPSLVSLMLYSWLVVLSLYGTLTLLSTGQAAVASYTVILSIGVVCGLVVLYLFIRLYITKYELSLEALYGPFQQGKLKIPVSAILSAEASQTAVQKLLGTGDVLLDAAVDGVLTPLRIHNIPQAQQRSEQIMYLVRDQR